MLSTSYAIIVFVGLLVAWLGRRYSAQKPFRSLPRVGIDPGWFGQRRRAAQTQFYEHGQKLLEQGYAEYKDTPYMIQTCDDERLVVPDKFIEELKNLPDTQLSFKEQLLDRFMGGYTKMDAVRGSDYHREIVRGPLTKSLGNLLPRMKEEAEFALDRTLSGSSSKGTSPWPSTLIFDAIGQITSRIIVDESLSRDPTWLETIMGYTASVAVVSMTMRRLFPALRPVAYWTMECGRKLRADMFKIHGFLVPVIQARRRRVHRGNRRKEHGGKGDSEGPQDILQWLSESAEGKDAQPEQISLKILFLIVAAMHTSAITAIHALYDLCAHPEFIEELRAEATSAIEADGWSTAALLKLPKMESFLKESGRTNSAGIVSFQRHALKPVRLSNGFTIPAGTHICDAADARTRDPALYPSPLEFQPLRFLSPNTETDASSLFSSVAAGDSWFGTGRQACPGRWYASAQIKLVLCLLLLKYDFKYPEGKIERPKNWVHDEKTGPDMEQMILIKERDGRMGEGGGSS
ncbi:cytochrome P450 [Lentithecium fluviatile CBS 122367]|uniref:Cytochrome P450 n=1 Tax=Lentithecium fluviatile CBS 122367 TaxID=1168545 RepID=A0A6G1J736_9PLEO|nr:cytochrome P450 [Lentithecium fluviatile CBS 122367]